MSVSTAFNQEEFQALFSGILAAKAARDYPAALALFRRAFRMAPPVFSSSHLWAALFNASDWYGSDAEGDAYIDYADGMMAELQALGETDPALAATLAKSFLEGALFRQTTHNTRPLTGFMARRAALFRLALRNLAPVLDHRFATPVSAGGKLRYGILLKKLTQDPETIGALSYFEFARAADLEVVVFVTEAEEQPGFADRIRAVADQVIRLPPDLLGAVQALRTADLDILFYANDVTAKASLTSYLPFFRVARRSFTCVASIATTAAPFMDAYLGAAYFKARGFDAEFTERFIALPFPGFCFSTPVRTTVDPDQFSRARLGIPADAVVFTTGANYTKLHGALLESWGRILKAVPGSYLLLCPFPPHFGQPQGEIAESWLAMMEQAGASRDQIRILPSLGSRDAMIALLKAADIGLDSFPYSGLTTIVDSVEAHLPVIALGGPLLRNNHAAAILDGIGASALIATTQDDYVDRTVALARDPAQRAVWRRHLADVMAGPPNFLDPPAYCRAVVGVCRMLYDELKAGA